MRPLSVLAALLLSNLSFAAEPLTIDVHRDANCGCCKAWISHLQDNGFKVTDHVETNMSEVKQRLGIKWPRDQRPVRKVGGMVYLHPRKPLERGGGDIVIPPDAHRAGVRVEAREHGVLHQHIAAPLSLWRLPRRVRRGLIRPAYPR